jgi:hypothetical protein
MQRPGPGSAVIAPERAVAETRGTHTPARTWFGNNRDSEGGVLN